MSENTFLGSADLQRVLNHLTPLKCLDVGAFDLENPYGPWKDLMPLAPFIELYGIEPDREECRRIEQLNLPFKKVRMFPVALSEFGGMKTFHKTRRRFNCSFLEPRPHVGQDFSRADYFTVEERIEMETVTLPGLMQKEPGLQGTVYLKLDTEGLELEILRSIPRVLLSKVMVIRSEVGFLPMRINEPYYCDIARYLRDRDFLPMRFIDMQHWRRQTREKYPHRVNGFIPFSRGQLAHADVLFFKNPQAVKDIELLLELAFIALAYEYVDHAFHILSLPEAVKYLQDKHNLSTREIKRAMGTASKHLANRYQKRNK